jgi:ABC-type cobalt transport system substrate-binding protein
MPHREVRVVLEWLGLIEPDRSRREPAALPTWAPWVVTSLLLCTAAIGAVVIGALLGVRG